MLNKYLHDESGATAIEYGLIAALISVSLIAGYQALGDSLNAQWEETAAAISGAGFDFLDE